MERLSL